MGAFSAKYGGRCGGCQERIVPGDDVVYVDDELVHVGCEGDAIIRSRRAKPDAVVCTVCFIEKPCACDDGQGPS